MPIKDRLQIILITYNREKFVEKTFRQLLAGDSPVKDINFLVLDNNSGDNTGKLVKEWQKKFPNLSYHKNKYNLGLAGNISRAMELADKDYVWIIGDDDKYDFSNWGEVEKAIEHNEKIICVARYTIPDKFKDDPAYQIFQLTFITGGIYKTELFDDTSIRNVLDNVYTMFPHICAVVKLFNENGKPYVVSKAISDNGMDIEHTDVSYTRGAKSEDLYIRSRTMSWIVGYCDILSQLKNKKLKEHSIDIAICSKAIFGSFDNFYRYVSTNYLNQENFMHFMDIYLNIGKQRADKLKQMYIDANIPGKCDFMDFSLKRLLFRRIKNFIFNLQKTPFKRYMTVFGIRIVTVRKKHIKKNHLNGK